MLPPGRWALTPPFHPYLRNQQCEDVSQVSLRDATVLCSTGGIFSVALSVNSGTGFSLCFSLDCANISADLSKLHRLKSVPLHPWRYQARCPAMNSAPHKVRSVLHDGVRTFLPSRLCSGEFISPQLSPNQRSPGSPA